MKQFSDAWLKSPAGIREWRRAQGFSQAQLAKILMVHKDTVRFRENGRHGVSQEPVLALRYLEVLDGQAK